MGDLHSLTDYRAQKSAPTAATVLKALQMLGGSAHQTAIIDLIVAWAHPSVARESLVAQVNDVLRGHRQSGAGGFRPMFGPDSMRWMVADAPAHPGQAARSSL